ncbi:Ribonuclease III [Loigolactobacillus coryniformis subsp. coryniformis CECT 5711]|uniref:Mini-ribonuclease 3 n=2 Tax=Loigolactobacillus coryniformis subsp. coryniformis TaxID=115541 RepID=J3EQ58_9LACO|nr:Ribonuclease III [Loigolactobacillus coryniformis subsp. coryniformis CECT 5711]
MAEGIMTEVVDYRQLNGIALAYMGDASYEVYIRRHLLSKGITKPTRLQHQATHFVSAKAQAGLIEAMLAQNILNEAELSFYKRGRNANSHTHAKNTSVTTYRISTGFEALMGYLALSDQQERLDELAAWCIAQVEEGKINEQIK